MGKRKNREDVYKNKFYRIPQEFFKNDKYKKMSLAAKLLYGFLDDRTDLSLKNNWIDENGDIYLIFTRKEIQEMLCLSDKPVTAAFRELNKYGLIEEIKLGLNKPNLIYICHLDPSTPEDIGNRRISDSGIVKSPIQGSENLRPNYTDNNYTDNLLAVEEATSFFEDNICKLKKITEKHFLNYCNEYDIEFIKAIVELCAEINTESFAGFKVIANGYIEKGIITRQSLETYVAEYRNQSKKIREKEREKRKTRANKASNNATAPKESTFNNFEQRTYDFEDLEKKLLGLDKE